VGAKQKKLKQKATKSSTQKQKKTRRSKTKYAALDPKVNLKIRTELLDYDYLSQLNEEELEWLNKFTEEYVHASLNTKNPRKNLHRTKKMRIDCYNRNNSRNRDVLTRNKMLNKLDGVDKLLNVGYDEEEKVHNTIDAKIQINNLKKRKLLT
jgi:hypothetical protein